MNRTNDALAVKKVVGDYIKGTAASDPDLLRSLFHETAVMSGYLGPDLLLGGAEPFFQAIAERRVGPEYVGVITAISVNGRTATATVVEDRLYDLSFTNSFHLLKVDDEWLITAKLFHHD